MRLGLGLSLSSLALHGGAKKSGPPTIPFASNLVAHFDAATPALSNGATVSSWTDSVNGIVAGTTVGTAPVYATNRINSLPSIQFGGAGGLEIASPGALKTVIDSLDYTVFIVFRTLGSSSFGGLFSAANGGASGLWCLADGTNVANFGISGPTTVPYAGQTSFSTFGTTAFNTTPTYSSSGKFNSFYINGGAYSSSISTPAGTNSNAFRIGTTVNNFPANAEIFDILVYDRPLSPAEYMQVEMWARTKYAQTYPWASLSAFNVFFGDSITQGINASDVVHQAPYLAAQSLGLGFGQWHNIGVGGIYTQHMDTLATSWIDPLPAAIGKTINLVGFEWYNEDLQGGLFAPPVPFNHANTYLANRKAVTGIKTVWGTSTSNSSDPVASRASYDASFDAAHTTNIDSYMPIHLDAHIGVHGSYATYSSATGGDGVHLTDTTYPYLAALFVSGINAL
jgi:hypothetical protein